MRLAGRNTAESQYSRGIPNLGGNSVTLLWVKKRLNRNINGISGIFKCPENVCNYLIFSQPSRIYSVNSHSPRAWSREAREGQAYGGRAPLSTPHMAGQQGMSPCTKRVWIWMYPDLHALLRSFEAHHGQDFQPLTVYSRHTAEGGDPGQRLRRAPGGTARGHGVASSHAASSQASGEARAVPPGRRSG